jgi:hypothetical protein
MHPQQTSRDTNRPRGLFHDHRHPPITSSSRNTKCDGHRLHRRTSQSEVCHCFTSFFHKLLSVFVSFFSLVHHSSFYFLDRSQSSLCLQNESPKPCSCLLSIHPAQFPARVSSLSKPPQTCPPLPTPFRVYPEQTLTNLPTIPTHF